MCGDHLCSESSHHSNISNYVDLPLHSIEKKLYRKKLCDERRYYHHCIDASFCRKTQLFNQDHLPLAREWFLKGCHFLCIKIRWMDIALKCIGAAFFKVDFSRMFALLPNSYQTFVANFDLPVRCRSLTSPVSSNRLNDSNRFLYFEIGSRSE